MNALLEKSGELDYGIRKPCSNEVLHLTRRVKGR